MVRMQVDDAEVLGILVSIGWRPIALPLVPRKQRAEVSHVVVRDRDVVHDRSGSRGQDLAGDDGTNQRAGDHGASRAAAGSSAQPEVQEFRVGNTEGYRAAYRRFKALDSRLSRPAYEDMVRQVF